MAAAQRPVRSGGLHRAADDDQTIYSFTGATPEAVLDPDIPADHKIILKQSYRVPRAIHCQAMRLIKQVTRRQEKDYLPRPEDGECIRLSTGAYKSPEYFILKSALQHLERGQTVMFLAACGYMLQPLVAVLRRNAIPFHNPYRKSNGFWNPLRIGRGSTPSRILALLVAHPGFGDGRRRVTASVFKRAQSPLDVAGAHGPAALIDVPRVVVGTIHSVKGGEADVVYLFADLSGEADRQYQRTGPPRDAVIRQFYVGMTRARQTLYICPMETGTAGAASEDPRAEGPEQLLLVLPLLRRRDPERWLGEDPSEVSRAGPQSRRERDRQA